jgi:hypothetical protein
MVDSWRVALWTQRFIVLLHGLGILAGIVVALSPIWSGANENIGEDWSVVFGVAVIAIVACGFITHVPAMVILHRHRSRERSGEPRLVLVALAIPIICSVVPALEVVRYVFVFGGAVAVIPFLVYLVRIIHQALNMKEKT